MNNIKIFEENRVLRKGAKPIEYFENENGCFVLINRYINRKGYGVIVRDKKWILVHRYTYEIVNGKIPDKFVVMHKCDNPICINPKHLKIGTQIDNVKDCLEKGRQTKGENQWKSKLTEKEVVQIKEMFDLGYNIKTLSKIFNVHRETIADIKKGRTWKHL